MWRGRRQEALLPGTPAIIHEYQDTLTNILSLAVYRMNAGNKSGVRKQPSENRTKEKMSLKIMVLTNLTSTSFSHIFL